MSRTERETRGMRGEEGRDESRKKGRIFHNLGSLALKAIPGMDYEK